MPLYIMYFRTKLTEWEKVKIKRRNTTTEEGTGFYATKYDMTTLVVLSLSLTRLHNLFLATLPNCTASKTFM